MSDKIVVGVAGLGLIGGSLALDLQKQGHAILCCDKDSKTCDIALESGMAHAASANIETLADATVIFIAVPVCATKKVLEEIARLDAPNLRAIFDAGSTKRQISQSAAEALGDRSGIFVPCHPIAGREHSGVNAATKSLFKDKRVIICGAGCSGEALGLVKGIWESCGAKVNTMDVETHDRVFGAVSHLPHLLAYSLVGLLGHEKNKDLYLSYAASGFEDFTRIASSDPDMWRDVCLTNRENLLGEIEKYVDVLSSLKTAVDEGDGESMRKFFHDARALRDDWLLKREIK